MATASVRCPTGPGSAVRTTDGAARAATAPHRSQNDQHTGDRSWTTSHTLVRPPRPPRRPPCAARRRRAGAGRAGRRRRDLRRVDDDRRRDRGAAPVERAGGRRPGVRRAPRDQRRGRGGQPVDPRRRALRLVLLPAGADVLRHRRAVRHRRQGPRDARRDRSPPTTTTRSGRSRSARGSRSPTARRSTPPPSSTTCRPPAPANWCQPRCVTSPRVPDPDHPDRTELKIDADRRHDPRHLHRQGRRPRPAGPVAQLRRPAHRRSGA